MTKFYPVKYAEYCVENTATAQEEHYIYHFPNGYGASIIRNEFSYGHEWGQYELAVLIEIEPDCWDICYDTPITNDVIGYLRPFEIVVLLNSICAL